MLKKILLWFVTVIGIILLGTLLISLVYVISPNNLETNLINSMQTFRQEEIYEKCIPDQTISILDNYTDSLMLLISSYRGNESLLDKGMNDYRIYQEGKSPYEQMTLIDNTVLIKVISYYRYWHGYLIFLRPLLALFNYSQIRIINTIVQLLLLIILCILMKKKGIGKYIIPFLSMYIMACPLAIFKSLQNSTIWYVSCVSLIMYLIFKEKIIKYKLHYILFTIVGMITSFMDFLTYPIATLGILIIFVLISEDLDLRKAIKYILICGTFWTLGYSIMWASKWILATNIIGKDVIKNGIDAIIFRSSNISTYNQKISRLEVVKNTFEIFNNKFTHFVIVNNLLICLLLIIKNKKKYTKKNIIKAIKKAIPILLICLMPIAWYLVLTNHTKIHPFLAFRTALPLWFAVFAIMYIMVLEGVDNEKI